MTGNKYLSNNAGVITEIASNQASAGSGDAGKLVALGASGTLDLTMMPSGIGPDTQTISASENLTAGALVNVWNSTGAKVRNADATVAGKEAHGFVLASVSSGASATVYFIGNNSGLTGLTPGVQFLQTTPGTVSTTPPSATGNVVQRVGFATSATNLNFDSQPPIVLA